MIYLHVPYIQRNPHFNGCAQTWDLGSLGVVFKTLLVDDYIGDYTYNPLEGFWTLLTWSCVSVECPKTPRYEESCANLTDLLGSSAGSCPGPHIGNPHVFSENHQPTSNRCTFFVHYQRLTMYGAFRRYRGSPKSSSSHPRVWLTIWLWLCSFQRAVPASDVNKHGNEFETEAAAHAKWCNMNPKTRGCIATLKESKPKRKVAQ